MTEGSDRSSKEPAGGAEKIGRRLAQAVVFAAVAYIAIVAYGSVIPRVFWPESSPEARERAPTDCEQGLRELSTRLERFASEKVGSAGQQEGFSDLTPFLATWDDDYLAMKERCEGPTTEALDRHRHHLETALRRYDREDGQLAREVERALASHP